MTIEEAMESMDNGIKYTKEQLRGYLNDARREIDYAAEGLHEGLEQDNCFLAVQSLSECFKKLHLIREYVTMFNERLLVLCREKDWLRQVQESEGNGNSGNN